MEAFVKALIAGNFPASQNIIKKQKESLRKGGKLLKSQNIKLFKISCQSKYSTKTKGKPKERREVIEKAKYKIIKKTQVKA